MAKAKKIDIPQYKNTSKKVAELIPYANNYRTHSDKQVKAIASQIKQRGITQPPLIDEEGVIIAGHGRVMAAELLKLEEIDVRVAIGWSENDKKAYLIADNKIQEMGGDNVSLLELEVEELLAAGYELGDIGLDDDFYANLAENLEDAEPPADFGDVDESALKNKCPRCEYEFD